MFSFLTWWLVAKRGFAISEAPERPQIRCVGPDKTRHFAGYTVLSSFLHKKSRPNLLHFTISAPLQFLVSWYLKFSSKQAWPTTAATSWKALDSGIDDAFPPGSQHHPYEGWRGRRRDADGLGTRSSHSNSKGLWVIPFKFHSKPQLFDHFWWSSDNSLLYHRTSAVDLTIFNGDFSAFSNFWCLFLPDNPIMIDLYRFILFMFIHITNPYSYTFNIL